MLADPTAHTAIDGAGRVQEAVDRAPLTEVGQILREYIKFPPFGPEHFSNSLHHLAELCRTDVPPPGFE